MTELDDDTYGNEEWRPVSGYPYEVSSHGRVRRIGGRPLKPKAKKQGYLFVCFSVDGIHTYKHVSRLVCEAFRGPPPTQEHHADHEDDDRQNNHWRNLNWLSPEANRAKRKVARGDRSGVARLSSSVIPAILSSTMKPADLAKQYGVAPRTIRDVINGKTWSHAR